MTTITTIKIRGGLKADLPLSAELHELLLTRDTGELFYGMGLGNPVLRIGGGHVPDVDITGQVDGVTNIFNVGEAYMPGSLVVYFCLSRLRKSVDTNIYDVVELDPDTGTFELVNRVPQPGDTLIVEFHRKINL
jgi:hypothetical protein